MVAEVFAGLSGFKAMLDIAKSFKDMNDANARKAVAIELQGQILSQQEKHSGLIEQVHELKDKLAAFEKWETEKARYKLCNITVGSLAYALRRENAEGEPPHWLCTDCYENRRKSILKRTADMMNSYWNCHPCGSSVVVPLNSVPGYADDTYPKG
jgi:hypothetical protein